MTPEQIEKERLEFEAWIHPTENEPEDLLEWNEYGGYLYCRIRDYWQAWLARAKQPAWVSVEDRLPELDTPVHALFDGHVGIFTRCDDNNGSWLWARCYGTSSSDDYGAWLLDNDYQSITHWQPLPTPPKGEKP